MVHLKKKENFIISGLKNHVLVRMKKYSGHLIDHKMTTGQYPCIALDLAAKDL